MRRKYVYYLMFAGLVLLIVLRAAPLAAATRPTVDERETATPVAVQRVGIPATGLRDEAAMVLVGTTLIGLAAAVRRAA